MKEVDKDIQLILEQYQFSFKELDPEIVTETSQFSSFDKLFYEAFSELSFIHKEKVNYISDMLYIAVMTTDRLIDDNKDEFKQELVFFSKILWEKALSKLQSLFPLDHVFWKYYDKYHLEYATACLKENRLHFDNLIPYEGKEFRELAAGKAAIAKIPITAMCLLGKQESIIPQLESSIDHYFIGLQVKDDLVDWRIDWANKRYSFLLTNVIYLKKWEHQIDQIEEDDLGRVIFYADYAFIYLEGAYKAYQKALDAVELINCIDWKNFVEKCAEGIRDLQVHIRDTVDKEIEKIEL